MPTAEYNPFECIKTNIIGAMNVIDAAIDKKIEKYAHAYKGLFLYKQPKSVIVEIVPLKAVIWVFNNKPNKIINIIL